jgi:hypothetical protein
VRQLLEECRRLGALEKRLPAIRKGEDRPAGAAEQLLLADLCHHYRKGPADAVPFYAAAFAAAPALADDLGRGYRYEAARAAALAARGDRLPPAERSRLRRQALEWLRADLQLWDRRLTAGPKGRAAVREKLGAWLHEADLAGVHGPDALAKLPPEERAAWRQFWDDVGKVRGFTDDVPEYKTR